MYLTLNTGKRSVTLDLSTRTGQELLLQLAGQADLIVESYRPGTLERFGLGPERLAQAGPAALVRISNFGQTGPMRDFAADDLIEYAAAGILQITGLPDRGPVALGLFTPLFLAGAICAPLALGAMRAAHRDQQQEVVDFSIQEALAGSMDRGGPNLVAYQYTGSLMVERRAAHPAKRAAERRVPVRRRVHPGHHAADLVQAVLPGHRETGVDRRRADHQQPERPRAVSAPRSRPRSWTG